MYSNRNLISPFDGSSMARLICSLPFSSAAKMLTIVFLIVIEVVPYTSSQHHLANATLPSFSNSTAASSLPYTSAAQHLLLSDTHRLAKRMDLEACLGQFDVHTNTIIRTGDSQAIGGKFLQGLELDTIEQCQRLCCETESCDVYIFESKNGSYCYLFECGPPENFHCKFTRHANFTSAVLTPRKRFIEVTTTRPPPPTNLPQHTAPSISQQEWELTSLKTKPEIIHDKISEFSTGISSGAINSNVPTSQMGQQLEINFPQKAIVNSSTPHCGRFQFACHSGECIAVYNACDGIPQCEDGSDEGPECTTVSQSNGKGNLESAKTNPNGLDATIQKYPPPPLIPQTPQQQLQTIQQQQRQSQQPFNSAVVNNREDANAWANRKIVTETQQADGNNLVDLNSHIFTHKNGLQLPHTVDVMDNANNGASNTGAIDLNTGIVNYPNTNGNLNPIYATTIQRSGIYMPQATVPQRNDGAYIMPHQPIMSQQGHVYGPANVNWAQQQQQFPAVVTPLTISNERGTSLAQGPAYVISTQQQAAPNFSQQQQPQQQQPAKAIYQAPAISNSGLAQTQQTAEASSSNVVTVHDSAQPQKTGEASKGSTKKSLSTTDDSYEEDYENESTEPPRKKLRKHKKVKSKPTASAPNVAAKEQLNQNSKVSVDDDPVKQAMEQRKQTLSQSRSQPPSPVHEQYRMIHENLAMEFREHDGQSDRPSGAVLSLTLGLLVTAALAILIGCRMRTVGRRARRLGGKTPYSNEADFLVNGMYL